MNDNNGYFIGSDDSDIAGYLTHHGILGMKWGIRRYQNKDGSLTDAGKKRRAKLERQLNNLDSKKIEERKPERYNDERVFDPKKRTKGYAMETAELEDAIQRLQLEKRYKDLMKELYPVKEKKKLIDGRKIASDIMTSALTDVGKGATKYVLKNVANTVAKEAFGAKTPVFTDPSNKDKKEKDK